MKQLLQEQICKDLIVIEIQGEYTILVLLDSSTAFDTVYQVILLIGLSALGIDRTVLEWFKNYLKNSNFRVCAIDNFSNDSLKKTGVPRGRLIGPSLFLI